jgi:hypothetical protein
MGWMTPCGVFSRSKGSQEIKSTSIHQQLTTTNQQLTLLQLTMVMHPKT